MKLTASFPLAWAACLAPLANEGARKHAARSPSSCARLQASQLSKTPELVRLGASPCKILTEVPGRQLAPQHLLKNDLFEALRRASGWPRRDLTAASVFVVFGELDFVQLLCLSEASRLELGKERKSARSGAWA